jgi:ubiquinol-cytochrome c reductase cytochrome c1 subunit
MRFAALVLAGVLMGAGAAAAQEETIKLPQQDFSFNGPFGTFDRAAAQRGFQVYKEVCSACHSMKELYYRNLEGIGLTPDQVKAVAASVTVPGELDDQGQPTTRPGLPADHFRSPFPNDLAARAANNGSLPPDQSVLEKAREDGANYIFDLMNGYRDAPAGVKVGDGLYYNLYFPGHQIGMPQPLHDGQVTYSDGTPATVEQMSRDVVTFLTYVANPEMEQRKRMGVRIVLFLIGMTCITYAVKRKVWADVH